VEVKDATTDEKREWMLLKLREELKRAIDLFDEFNNVANQKLKYNRENNYKNFLEQINIVLQRYFESERDNDFYQKIQSLMPSNEEHTFEKLISFLAINMEDIAHEFDRPMPEVVMTGTSLKFNAEVGQTLKNIFIHLIRNSIDHGIETIEERELIKKRTRGRIYFHTESKGSNVVIAYSDDGRGINLEAIKLKAYAEKVIPKDQMDKMTEVEWMDLIFSPFFSTSATVTELSGRGIGMSRVRHDVESMGGKVEIFTNTTQGPSEFRPFQFLLSIPQTNFLRIGKGHPDNLQKLKGAA
jgi:chemotaxis protein histidine kinase CheA